MLRSLYSGISGLRSHQTMLDVTGNNIANVNTSGFKASSTQFQDTLSQMTQGAGGPQPTAGGTNPAQIGLGVQVAGISTNFAQGSAQATGKSTDMMISGDGFFVTELGGEQVYARAGAFDLDANGRLVTPSGAILQGWIADNDGNVPVGGAVGNIVLSKDTIVGAEATTRATIGGNLPSDGTESIVRDIEVFGDDGSARNITLTFTPRDVASGSGWNVRSGNGDSTSVAFNPKGELTTASPSLNVGGIDVNLSGLTGYAGMSTVAVAGKDGSPAGTLESFSLAKDGTLIGAFSNGEKQAVGRIALANFTNPAGLEKVGSSGYRATANSGAANLGAPGSAGLGTLAGGYLEMSNVDLAQEFTNLIVAQRGFQANARIITTSDELLQELTNLKR